VEMIPICHIQFCWVPSHSTHPEWKAPNGFDTEEWRTLNAEADARALAAAKILWERYESEHNQTTRAKLHARHSLLELKKGSNQLRNQPTIFIIIFGDI